MSNPRIIIIGAGAAGYAAACKLLEHGFSNIKILEAENRIGGRINSVEFGNGLIDMGAQWCHGEKKNSVFEMVENLNLLQHSVCNYKEFLFVDSDGNFVDSNLSDQLIGLLFEISDDTEALKTFNGSLGDYITNRYETILSNDYPELNRTIAKQLMDWYHKLINNLNASANWYEISARGLTQYEECDGDSMLNWKDKGYGTIFSVLNKEIPDYTQKLPIDEKILFNKEVCRITWEDYKRKRAKEVLVECIDGSSYSAEHVIVTTSLGVLQDMYKTLFAPELPTFKKNAIQGLTMGCIDKIFLKFPKKWWPDSCTGFDLVWKEEDINKLLINFPDGPSKNGKSWLEGIFGFHPIDNNPNVLLAFINGESVPDAELLSDDVIVKGCMYLLKRFLGKHFDIPAPDGMLRTYWHSNKHFRGTYSFRSIETEKLNTSASDLAAPLGENALLFAGEATHSKFYSTVHGAIETGFREANRLITQYRSQTKSKAHL